MTTAAGRGSGGISDGGPPTDAGLDPAAVAVDSAGNLYIAETQGNHVRRVSADGTISTIAGRAL